MPSNYSPRIKATTAKNIAKGILSDKTGKKISDTKFKELMKKDKNLKKFAYTGKNSTLDKFKAKKFFKTVVDSAEGSEKFKVNKIAAKKLGLKINKKGEASQIGLNKVYQKATADELAAADTGPTKQELRRQAKREKAIQKMRQQDRASDRRNEYDKEAKDGDKKSDDSSNKSSSAPTRQAGSGTGAANITPPNKNDNQISVSTSKKDMEVPELPNLLIPPLNNLSPTQANLDVITKKLDISVKHKLYNLKIFNVIGQDIVNKSLMNMGMDKIPTPSNVDVLKHLTNESGAQLFIYGTVQKKANILKVNIDVINSETDQKISLVSIEQNSLDLFDLEKKINWQIDNALVGSGNKSTSNLPTENDAIDLPI